MKKILFIFYVLSSLFFYSLIFLYFLIQYTDYKEDYNDLHSDYVNSLKKNDSLSKINESLNRALINYTSDGKGNFNGIKNPITDYWAPNNHNLRQKNDSLININEFLNRKLLKYTSDEKDEFFYDGKENFNGIKNPQKYLEDALVKRKDLIPAKSVLGGTMNFTYADTYGNGWIIGHYDDGHIGGEAIYTYKLLKNKKVEFKLLYYRTNK